MTEIGGIIKFLEESIEILKVYEELMDKGNCNTCKLNRSCQYLPQEGEVVRINCPLYAKPEGGIVKVVTPQKDKEEGAINNDGK